LIRFFIDIVPGEALWLGIVILLIGAASSLLGVLYALCEHDLKRLLAYHSIENIGIILLGLGGALVFGALGFDALMILALVASLYHTANHAVFKALLFLGAGSVAHATHTRNIEEYGGLIKTMGWTAGCFLIGSLAISGMPPFNGFVSEWLTFQALFAGIAPSSMALTVLFLVGISSLAFTGGLAAACFVKAFGAVFLAKPRSEHARHAHECGMAMRLGMAGLALLALLLGIGSGYVVPALATVAEKLTGAVGDASTLASTSASIVVRDQFAALSMPAIAALLLGLLIAAWVVVAIISRNRKITTGLTWDCGSPLSSRMEITATGFSRSLLIIFKALVRPTKKIESVFADKREYVLSQRTVDLGVHDVYETYGYNPLHYWTDRLSLIAKKIQSGNVNAYILYVAIALLLMMIWTSLF
ncbi:MAG: proton-conducting transporter membrane subunit, partial [Patescibacteria group bacterium]